MNATKMQVGEMNERLHITNMKKVLLFVNSKARQGQKAALQVKEWLDNKGYQIVNTNIDCERDEMAGLIGSLKDNVSAVIVGGGDGSVNCALPALMKCKVPLLILPLGTANNLARTLGLPPSVEENLNLLERGSIGDMDVGIANGIPFVNVVGIGLSTQVNRLVRGGMKRWFGVFAFIWTAMKVARRMNPFKAWIECDGWQRAANTWQITVCNGRNYGSGLVIHEKASLHDRLLHGLSTEIKSWREIVPLIFALVTGRFKPEHAVTTFKGSCVRIRTKHPMSVDLDGDVRARTPLEITVATNAIRVYVPEAYCAPSS